MKRWVRLSWDLDTSTPLYPGTPSVQITPERSIAGGDACNTSVLILSSHAGTHVDAPRHFFDEGRSLVDYNQDELVFTRPLVLECPQQPGGIIGRADLDGIAQRPDADIILIRTGFQILRERDPECYCTRNPCLSPEAVLWLRREFPGLRALGLDCISVASRMHRELGRETHRALLQSGHCSEPLLVVEDMRLPTEHDRFEEVIVCPLMPGCADGSPCVVLGVLAGD